MGIIDAGDGEFERIFSILFHNDIGMSMEILIPRR